MEVVHDKLCDGIRLVINEYLSTCPNHIVSIKLAISYPDIAGKYLIETTDFLNGNNFELSNVSIAPDPLVYNNMLALTNAGNNNAAIQLGLRLVEQYPSNPKVYEWLATIYWRTSMFDDVLRSYNRALQIAESPEWTVENGIGNVIEIKLSLGQCLHIMNKQSDGNNQFYEALQVAKNANLTDFVTYAESLIEQYKDN